MRNRATCAVTPGGTWRTISSSTMRFEDGMINPMRAVMLTSAFAKYVPTSNSSLAWRRSHREHGGGVYFPKLALRILSDDVVGERSDRPYSGLMLAARITLAHFSVSSAMSLAQFPGEPAIVPPPKSGSRAFNVGSARPALISLLILS